MPGGRGAGARRRGPVLGVLCSWGSAVCGVLGLWCRGRVLLCRLRVRGSWGVVVAFWGSVVRGCGVVGRPARVLPSCWGGVGWGVCCRVLGRCALVWPVWCPAGGVLVGAAVGGLVVICIVDASIFVLCVARAAPPPGCVGVWSVVLLVFGWVCVLFFWAFGGCLGIRGR